jgi:hypothetical protein
MPNIPLLTALTGALLRCSFAGVACQRSHCIPPAHPKKKRNIGYFHIPYLRYRGKKSLGWVPFKGRELKREGDAFRFAGNTFRVFHSRALPEGKIKDGSNFSCDSRGNWFLNIVMRWLARLKCASRSKGCALTWA